MEAVTSEVRAGEPVQTARHASLPRRVAERAASALPRGGSLPEESWRRRHHAAHAGEIAGKDRFGLMAMRERISMLGGSFEVESGSGAGTRIRAVVPRGEVVT